MQREKRNWRDLCEARRAIRKNSGGKKQKFAGNLPGAAVRGPLHDWGGKHFVPVLGQHPIGVLP